MQFETVSFVLEKKVKLKKFGEHYQNLKQNIRGLDLVSRNSGN